MTDTAPPEFDSEDWLIVHLNGFASGREYERRRVVDWLRGLAKGIDGIPAAEAYFYRRLADLIESGEYRREIT